MKENIIAITVHVNNRLTRDFNWTVECLQIIWPGRMRPAGLMLRTAQVCLASDINPKCRDHLHFNFLMPICSFSQYLGKFCNSRNIFQANIVFEIRQLRLRRFFRLLLCKVAILGQTKACADLLLIRCCGNVSEQGCAPRSSIGSTWRTSCCQSTCRETTRGVWKVVAGDNQNNYHIKLVSKIVF